MGFINPGLTQANMISWENPQEWWLEDLRILFFHPCAGTWYFYCGGGLWDGHVLNLVPSGDLTYYGVSVGSTFHSHV